MKKVTIFTILILAASVVLNSCRKNDNPALPDLERIPTPLLRAAPNTSTTIIPSNLANFSGSVVVDLYFKNDIPPQKFDLVIIRNGDKSVVKTLQADITSFPTTVTFSGTQLQTLFGQSVKTCDFFDIGVDITTRSGLKLIAFPTTGQAYAAGVFQQPGANTVVRYSTKVEFDPSEYSGDFEVVTDEWADYGVGDIVPLTLVSPTQVSFVYKPADPRPIIVNVDPNTLKTSVAKQVYGSGYPPGWTFGDISAESGTSNDNFVSPCEKTLSIRLKHTVAAGSFGEWKIVLKKKQ